MHINIEAYPDALTGTGNGEPAHGLRNTARPSRDDARPHRLNKTLKIPAIEIGLSDRSGPTRCKRFHPTMTNAELLASLPDRAPTPVKSTKVFKFSSRAKSRINREERIPRSKSWRDTFLRAAYLETHGAKRKVTALHYAILRVISVEFFNKATGCCCPSLEAIAEAAHCCVTTVKEAITRWHKIGFLDWDNRHKLVVTANGQELHPERTSNGYRLYRPRKLVKPIEYLDGRDVRQEAKDAAEVASLLRPEPERFVPRPPRPIFHDPRFDGIPDRASQPASAPVQRVPADRSAPMNWVKARVQPGTPKREIYSLHCPSEPGGLEDKLSFFASLIGTRTR